MDDLHLPKPVLVAGLLPEILDELIELLSGLSSDDWGKATVCAGWSVKDVALHLLGGEIGNLSRRRDGHDLGAEINNWDELVVFINDWNQNWVEIARRVSPRLLMDLMQFVGSQMCQYFASLDPYAMGGAVSWAGDDPAPVWLDVAREYTERWHHQQHIRDAVGKPGLNGPRYLMPVLATFVRALPRALQPAHAAEGASLTLAVVGESGGEWTALREDGVWRLYEGALAHPTARVTISEDLAWRLFTRGVSLEQARPQIIISGDQALGSRIFEMVSIIA
jgi:uncharacterized protein (TIGR03083 family)